MRRLGSGGVHKLSIMKWRINHGRITQPALSAERNFPDVLQQFSIIILFVNRYDYANIWGVEGSPCWWCESYRCHWYEKWGWLVMMSRKAENFQLTNSHSTRLTQMQIDKYSDDDLKTTSISMIQSLYRLTSHPLPPPLSFYLHYDRHSRRLNSITFDRQYLLTCENYLIR